MALPAFTVVGGTGGTEIKAIATAAMTAGSIYAWGAGFVYIDGNENYAIGDLFCGKDQVTLKNQLTNGTLTAATVAVDADIYVTSATGQVALSAGAGIIGPVGKATKAKAAGVEHVEFRLNKGNAVNIT